MSAYTDKLKGVPIKYKWDKNNYYTCIPQSQNHKSPQGWWNVVWEEDSSRSVVNLTEHAFRVGNWKFKYKQPRTKRSSKKASQGTAKPKQKSSPAVELSKYEVDRLKRIEENRKHMASLGLTIARDEISDRPNTPKKYATGQRPKRRKVVATVPRKGWRVSRRLRGRKAITKVDAERRNARQMAKRYEQQREQSERDTYQTLLKRYQRDSKWSVSSKKSSRNLFLVPTGTLGYNDHTLERKVPQLGSYLWGFASGT